MTLPTARTLIRYAAQADQMIFAKLKTLLRKIAARTKDALADAVGQVVDMVSGDDATHRIRHAGFS